MNTLELTQYFDVEGQFRDVPMRLTFEVAAEGPQVVIAGDPDGLFSLVRSIERLIAATGEGQANHSHLHTAEWAGDELSSRPWLGGEFEVAHHVKFYCDKGGASAQSLAAEDPAMGHAFSPRKLIDP